MNNEPNFEWFRFDPDAAFDPRAAQRAVNEALRYLVPPPSATTLRGPDALSMRIDDGWLVFDRLRLRTHQGACADLSGTRLPLPDRCEAPRSIGLRMAESWRPQDDSGCVWSWRPVAELTEIFASDAPEILPLGVLEPLPGDGVVLRAKPTRSERLDGCRAWRDWTAEARARLEALDELMLKVLAATGRSKNSPAVWAALAMPALHALAGARAAIRPERSPEEAVRALDGLAGALHELPIRAGRLGLPEFPTARAGDPTAAGDAGESIILGRLDAARSWLIELATRLGIEIERLPERLIRSDREFRRLAIAGQVSDDGSWRLLPQPGPQALAVLIESARATPTLGDVIVEGFARGQGDRSYVAPDPRGLCWLAPCHWDGRIVLRPQPGVRIRDAALYDETVPAHPSGRG